MRFLIYSLTIVAGLLVLANDSRANFITNGSFELGTNPPAFGTSGSSLGAGSTNLTGWTISGGSIFDGLGWLPNGNPFGPNTPFGNYFLDLTGYLDQKPYYGVSQAINTVVGQQYVLTFDLGVDQDNLLYSGPISVLAQAGSTSQTFLDNPGGTGSIWTDFTLNFTATSTSTTISLLGTQGNEFIGLDNVAVNTASTVPEPSSIALALIGGTVLAVPCVGRRLKRHQSLR
jgi:hypothetical protein